MAPAGRFRPTRRVLAATTATTSLAAGRATGREGRRTDVRALHTCTCAGVRREAPTRASVRVHALARSVCVRRVGGIATASSGGVPRQRMCSRSCQERV